MSSKTKGLEYSASQPAFLQRLRAQNSGPGERHERPIPRSKRAKAEDDDDAPAYVMEDTHDTLSKDEYKKLLADDAVIEGGGDRQGKGAVTSDDLTKPGAPDAKPEGNPTTGGKLEATIGQKKRKAVTAVGTNDDASDEGDQTTKPKKSKKKGKPIKLSFDDEAS